MLMFLRVVNGLSLEGVNCTRSCTMLSFTLRIYLGNRKLTDEQLRAIVAENNELLVTVDNLLRGIRDE